MAGRPRALPYPTLEDVLETVAFVQGNARVGQVWRLLLARAQHNGEETPSRDGTATRLRELADRGNLQRLGKAGGTSYVLVDAALIEHVEAHKVCASCGTSKPYSNFSGGGTPNSPLRPRCRNCENEMSRVSTPWRCKCGEYVLSPGKCGFCREEEAGERLTEAPAPIPLTPAENRSTLAQDRAGRTLYDVASNLG